MVLALIWALVAGNLAATEQGICTARNLGALCESIRTSPTALCLQHQSDVQLVQACESQAALLQCDPADSLDVKIFWLWNKVDEFVNRQCPGSTSWQYSYKYPLEQLGFMLEHALAHRSVTKAIEALASLKGVLPCDTGFERYVSATATLIGTEGVVSAIKQTVLSPFLELDVNGDGSLDYDDFPWYNYSEMPSSSRAAGVVGRIVLAMAAICLTFTGSLWMVWLHVSLILMALRVLLVIYQMVRISISLAAFSLLQLLQRAVEVAMLLSCSSLRLRLERQLAHASSYKEWLCIAKQIDEIDGAAAWQRLNEHAAQGGDTACSGGVSSRGDTSDRVGRGDREGGGQATAEGANRRASGLQWDGALLAHNIEQMQNLQGDMAALCLTLRSAMARNHGGSDSLALHLHCLSGTKLLVDQHRECMLTQLRRVCDSAELDPSAKLDFLLKCKQNRGNTALCLSGGGSLAMYHVGVCQSLLEHGLLPGIISGTSGGSIVTAFLAINTDAELMENVFVKGLPNRYASDGVRWFPPFLQEVVNFLTKGVLVLNHNFTKATQAYFGDVTFEEAFKRTGRLCNITVSKASSGVGTSLLLNHITTPSITIASAVAASCALPGIMKPHHLMSKDPNTGQCSKFVCAGNQFMDGSITADLPLKRLAEMFSVTQFIVSQVNPHVAPFIQQRPGQQWSSWRRLETVLTMDMMNRFRTMSTLGMVPTFFGQDIRPMFKPGYSVTGTVTLAPNVSISNTFNAIMHPSERQMEHYLKQGNRSTWPKLRLIRHLLAVDSELDRCIAQFSAEAGYFCSQAQRVQVATALGGTASRHIELAAKLKLVTEVV